MPSSETVLLQRFVRTQDPQAFSEIVHRHAGLVYGTCMRVLADADKAADVVQDTFLQLLKNAGSIHGSVPTWLHRVATNKSVDVIRRESSRRKREARYAGDQPRQVTEWSRLSRYVDEGLETLDPRTRQLIIAHFLQGATTTRLAQACGVSQPTVSRAIDSGVTQLRAFLKKQGVLVAAATLSGLLGANAVQAAPAAVLTELGKISLVGGPAAAAASSTATEPVVSGLLATAKAKVVATAAVVLIGAGTTFVVYNAVTGSDSAGVATVQPQPAASASSTAPRVSPASTAPAQTPVVPNDPEPTQESTPDVAAEQPATVADNSPAPPDETPAAEPSATPPAMGYGGMGMGGYGGSYAPGADFTSPQNTISSFARLLATGDMAQIGTCFAPGADDLNDLGRILTAPQDPGEIMMKHVFESVGPPVEVTKITEAANGVGVKWLFTVTNSFVLSEHGASMAFEPGDKFEMDATLVEVDGKWLIAGI